MIFRWCNMKANKAIEFTVEFPAKFPEAACQAAAQFRSATCERRLAPLKDTENEKTFSQYHIGPHADLHIFLPDRGWFSMPLNRDKAVCRLPTFDSRRDSQQDMAFDKQIIDDSFMDWWALACSLLPTTA